MATTVSHQRIPRNPRAGLAPQLSKMKIALDQLIPLNNARARVIPSVQGIAEAKRVSQILKQIGDTITGLQLINDAANGVGPNGANSAAQEWAAAAMAAPGFTQALAAHIETLKLAVAQVVANAKKATQPASAEPTDTVDPSKQKGPDFDPDQGPNAGANNQEDPSKSGTGTDAATYAPGGYTVAHLERDLAARAIAPRFFMQKNPKAGLDAALSEMAKIRFLPDLSSDCWSPQALKLLRDRASFDNELAEMLRSHGDRPTYQSEYNAERSSVFADYFNTEVEPKAMPHPRSFDR